MTDIEALKARISLHEEKGNTRVLPILYRELAQLEAKNIASPKTTESTE